MLHALEERAGGDEGAQAGRYSGSNPSLHVEEYDLFDASLLHGSERSLN